MEPESEPFLPQEKCLEQSELTGFLLQTLAGPEMDRARKHLEGCDLCRDALDGLSRVQPITLIPSLVKEVNRWALKRLERNKRKKKTQKFYILISLAVFIVLVVILVAYMAYRSAVSREKIHGNPAHSGSAREDPDPGKGIQLSVIDAGNLFFPVPEDSQRGGINHPDGGNGPVAG